MVKVSDLCLTNQENIRIHIKTIRKYKNEIDQNKNFEYDVPFTDRVEIPLQHGKKTTYCLDCMTTCHKTCIYDDD